MSSPFQKKFIGKSPLNKKSDEDKLIHATSSVNDKYALDITDKYDESYDKYTDKHGYIDPDEFDKMQNKNKKNKIK